jgi:prophage DNA circulation protein
VISQWRERLGPASFNGVEFHCELQVRASGRRIAHHQFPKRDLPYSEDMGREERTFTIGAYVIGSNYVKQRDKFVDQLEIEGPGYLVLPTQLERGSPRVVVGHYSVSERRERGGYAEFEILFIEAGKDITTAVIGDTQSQVSAAAQTAINGFQESAVNASGSK